jgi:hypothetical protein
MRIENMISSSSASVLYRITWKNNNISYRNLMNMENLISIHPPDQYWTGLYGKIVTYLTEI